MEDELVTSEEFVITETPDPHFSVVVPEGSGVELLVVTEATVIEILDPRVGSPTTIELGGEQGPPGPPGSGSGSGNSFFPAGW